MSSAICFDLDQSKILSSGNGLTKKASSIRKSICNKIFLANTCNEVLDSVDSISDCTFCVVLSQSIKSIPMFYLLSSQPKTREKHDPHDRWLFNSLSNDKMLDWSKLRAFADDIIKVL